MNTLFLNQILALLIGTVVTVGAVTVASGDLIDNAKLAVNAGNIHQLSTALEVYYSDFGVYPDVTGGQALINELRSKGYINSQPLDAEVFNYQLTDNGESYSLELR